jgi:hypothetical protein
MQRRTEYLERVSFPEEHGFHMSLFKKPHFPDASVRSLLWMAGILLPEKD